VSQSNLEDVDFLDPDSVAEAVGQKVHSIGGLLDEHEATLPYQSCRYFIQGIRIVLAAVEDYHAEWLEHITNLYSDDPGMRAVLIKQTSTNCLEIAGRSQRVDYSPLHQTPPSCPVPAAENRDFSLTPDRDQPSK